MADNYYQQQPPQGGRNFTIGGRRGRGRGGYRGRGGGGRQQSSFGGGGRDVAGGRSSSSRGRGANDYYGNTSIPPPPPLPPTTQQGDAAGRFSNTNTSSNAMPPTTFTSSAPTNTRGRGSRGSSSRFYDGSRGRRGRGRYSSRGRGRYQEQQGDDWDQQQWSQQNDPVTIVNPIHDVGRGGSSGPDWAGRERDWSSSAPDTVGRGGQQDYDAGETARGWNMERNPSFPGPSGDHGSNEWGAQNAHAPMDVDSGRGGSTDWAGRQRDWNNPTSGGPSSQATGGSNEWQDSNRSWNSNRDGGTYDESRGTNLSRGLSSAPSSGFAYSSDPMKRKREEQHYGSGGPPFEDKRPREVPTSSYASLGEREFRNPTPPPATQQAAVEEVPAQPQRFPGSSTTTWRGRGSRGRGRGSFQGKRYSGGRGEYGYQTGRGAPPSYYQDMSSSQPQQYHDVPPVGGTSMSRSEPIPPDLSAYGPQPDDVSARSAPPDHSAFPPGEGNASRGSFVRRTNRAGAPSSHTQPPPPIPPPPHVAPPSNVGIQSSNTAMDSSAPWNRPPPIQEPISTGSYASLAESPFVAEAKREPEQPVPPLSGTSYQPQSASIQPETVPVTKPKTPPLEPVVEQAPPSPPSPVGPPSGLMVALARLADLESQLDFALAKHMRITRERELVEEQTKHLEQLPVGTEAFEDDLAKLASATD